MIHACVGADLQLADLLIWQELHALQARLVFERDLSCNIKRTEGSLLVLMIWGC